MKKFLFHFTVLVFISATSQASGKLYCSIDGIDVHGKQADDECYRVVSSFEFSDVNFDFIYSSFYTVGRRFCGWPPAGDYIQGTLTILDNHYFSMDTIAGTLTFNDIYSKLTYENGEVKYEMDCKYLD